MSYVFYATLVFFIVLCVLFALLILIQKGRGGGISSAFGGAGGNTAFGSKTGDVLTWATAVVFAIFLTSAVTLNLLANRVNDAFVNGQTTVVAPGAATDVTIPDAPAPPAAHTDETLPPTSGPMSAVPISERSPGNIVPPATSMPTAAPANP